MKIKSKLMVVLLLLVVIGIYYYVTLPALSIHSSEFWMFIIFIFAMIAAGYVLRKRLQVNEIKESKIAKILVGIVGLLILVFAVGSILSSPIVNADQYRQLMTVEDGNITEDIEELSYDQIPILDKDSAVIIGNREMGSITDMVSQFEVDDIYSQINYNEKPVRVSPLKYASFIRWFTNQSEGIPGYIEIDMATQEAELVRLTEEIQYSEAEYFNRNIYRHLRFEYPTYIFDRLSFEIDDEGTPYYIAPVKKFNIGLFGGVTIGKAILVNAITGETTEYDIEEVPEWVDRVYSADLLVDLYNYHGTLVNGYFNSILGQRDCLQATEGHNYLAIDNDVWVYTGVTSVTSDQSNVGFVLMNQRTMETKFYEVEGATETSAMSSAEGKVQHLGYVATFPLLLNISDEPTYFIALKDAAGLVKNYAMVNVQKFQLVAIGDTVAQCEEAYVELLDTNGVLKEEDMETDLEEITGVISKITEGVIDGNSHYYILLQDESELYEVVLKDHFDIVRYREGDTITIKYEKDEKVNQVEAIE